MTTEELVAILEQIEKHIGEPGPAIVLAGDMLLIYIEDDDVAKAYKAITEKDD